MLIHASIATSIMLLAMNESANSKRKSEDILTKNLLLKKQVQVFLISYLINVCTLMGFSLEFITTSFYNEYSN